VPSLCHAGHVGDFFGTRRVQTTLRLIFNNRSNGEIQELVSAQPIEKGASQWYQKAKNLKISISEGYRSEVPKKSPTCPAWHNEGTEGVQGGKAGDSMKADGVVFLVGFDYGRSIVKSDHTGA